MNNLRSYLQTINLLHPIVRMASEMVSPKSENLHRYIIEVMYLGTAFHGSQLQATTDTVQLQLNKALTTIFRRPIETYGASRTDEGVHARCNFYHFDMALVPTADILYRLNAVLPEALSIVKIYIPANPEMNVRFDALSRRYRYRIYPGRNPFLVGRALYYPYRIDLPLLQQTAAVLKEYTDFETFAKRHSQTKTFRCIIMQSYWEEQGDELHYIVEANRFLRGMVRGLVGTQLRAARGKYGLEEFRSIIEAKDCTRADFSVAGHGLYLEQITYPEGSLIELK
jgi:tRNA pseudouridine38-40 synthase